MRLIAIAIIAALLAWAGYAAAQAAKQSFEHAVVAQQRAVG